MLARVKCSLLKECLSNLSPLFYKGSAIIPVGFKIKDKCLTVICNTKCSYKDVVPLEECEDGYAEVVVQYKNILDYLPTVGDIEIEINNRGLFVNHADVSLSLPEGYSTYKELDVSGMEFKPIVSTGFLAGLRTLMNFNLTSITNMEKPIAIYQQLAVVKYPQLIVQARTMGLPFSGMFTHELVNLMVRFQPTEVCDSNPNVITLKRNTAYLQIPRDNLDVENNFISFMSNLGDPVTLNIEGFSERLRCMSKLGNNLECHCVLHTHGLSYTVMQEGTTITNKLGNCDSEVLTAFKIPLSVFNMCVRALDGSTAQILYGGGKLCLRTQAVIIITRVMS